MKEPALPTYEYLCEKCAYRFEKREGFDAPARQKCEKCRKNTAQRMLFAPPIVFKGSGFYKTDNRGADTSDTASPNGSGKSDDTAAAAPAAPAASDGHGHSHGPGGHSHGTEATPAPAKSEESKPNAKSRKEAPKPAAAG